MKSYESVQNTDIGAEALIYIFIVHISQLYHKTNITIILPMSFGFPVYSFVQNDSEEPILCIQALKDLP